VNAKAPWVAVVTGVVLLADARADEPAALPPAETPSPDGDAPLPPEEDEATRQARESFQHGAELVGKARWSEALAAFERAAQLKPHAITTYNIGACLRALGRYLLARKHFAQALAEDEAAGGTQLSSALRTATDGYIGQIDDLLARATVHLRPATAAIAVDGRPLELSAKGDRPVLLAGTLPPGPGTAPPAGTFDVVLDPGLHVITVSLKGHRDAVVRRDMEPGSKHEIDLTVARLPATMRIDANQDAAYVLIDGREVGQTPLSIERRAGRYQITVEKEGFDPYETNVTLEPGQPFNVRADLPEGSPALYERWWFWSALGAAAASVAVTTYVVTRPEPTRPPADGGGLGWVVELP
jgi:PEGA domain-containing protein